MSDFFPTRFTNFLSWFKRFAEGVFQHRDKLNVSIESADKLMELYNETKLAGQNVQEAKSTYKAAVKVKEESRKKAIKYIRQTAGVIHSYPESPVEVLKGIGLDPHKKTRSFDSPLTPTYLFAKPLNKNQNLVSWLAKGNKRHTLYILEYKFSGDDKFNLLTATMSTKYKHTVSKSYARIQYRVKARRGSKESGYSNVAAVNLT